MTIRIGTRGSALALWQAGEVARLLLEHGADSQIVVIRTMGDARQNVKLASIGGKGVFIKELEEALDDDAIDLAVHSLKDVPSIVPDRFSLAAFLERADPRDAWIQPEGRTIDEIPPGAVVGTSAPRRRAQLRILYPALEIRDMRGNVDTRIAKVRSGAYTAAVLASAGITRLGRAGEITSWFPTDVMVPAAGQGIVAIETLARPRSDLSVLARINNTAAAVAATAERGVLQRFGTLLDCTSAVAVHAAISDGSISMRAFLSDPQGTTAIRAASAGPLPNANQIANAVADELIARGAMSLLSMGAKP
jgi:hydroxymethylbilane synthase